MGWTQCMEVGDSLCLWEKPESVECPRLLFLVIFFFSSFAAGYHGHTSLAEEQALLPRRSNLYRTCCGCQNSQEGLLQWSFERAQARS